MSLNSYSFETVKLDKSGNVLARPTGEARSFNEDLGGGGSLEMTQVAGGEFTRGSPGSEENHETDESPARHGARVLSRPL